MVTDKLTKPSDAALLEFNTFLTEVAYKRAETSKVSATWLAAVGVATGTDTLSVILRSMTTSGIAGIATRLMLPVLGSVFGPLGSAAGAVAATSWTVVMTRKHLERLAAGADPDEVKRTAIRLEEAEKLFVELQEYREDDPVEVKRQLQALFDDLVEDRPLIGSG